MKIKIKKNKKCDSRTCNTEEVSKDELLKNSEMHIKDVSNGMHFLAMELISQGSTHDHTKLSHIGDFYRNFKSNFVEQDWWELHQKEERHHFNNPEFIQKDVNLIDVMEQIVDGIMAGLARSGEYRQEKISPKLLLKAYNNTVKMLLANVEMEE